jgi:hypothetical protein
VHGNQDKESAVLWQTDAMLRFVGIVPSGKNSRYPRIVRMYPRQFSTLKFQVIVLGVPRATRWSYEPYLQFSEKYISDIVCIIAPQNHCIGTGVVIAAGTNEQVRRNGVVDSGAREAPERILMPHPRPSDAPHAGPGVPGAKHGHCWGLFLGGDRFLSD